MSDRKIWRRKRSTERVTARLWVKLRGRTTDIECSSLDISDTGIRMRIQLRDLGLEKNAGLFDVSRLVTSAFGHGCVAEVRHPKGSDWVRKNVALVRIGLLRRQAQDFEIGCRFDAPLDDAERRLLGFRLTTPSRNVG
jgi:hypothetical protein